VVVVESDRRARRFRVRGGERVHVLSVVGVVEHDEAAGAGAVDRDGESAGRRPSCRRGASGMPLRSARRLRDFAYLQLAVSA